MSAKDREWSAETNSRRARCWVGAPPELARRARVSPNDARQLRARLRRDLAAQTATLERIPASARGSRRRIHRRQRPRRAAKAAALRGAPVGFQITHGPLRSEGQVIGRSLSGSSSPALVDHGLDRRAVRRAIEAVGQPRRSQGPRTTSSRVRRGARSSRCRPGVRCTFGLRVSSPCRVPTEPARGCRSRLFVPGLFGVASRGSEIYLVS